MAPSEPNTEDAVSAPTDEESLREIARRVLWLSASIVDAANAGRPNDSGVKAGGHQASSASMVDIMVALWFAELTSQDRVSVKPHASPVLHAINYLLGDLDERFLSTLRAKGGLQSYPSRLKDPDTVDFSTGSVGIGATAAVWAAMAHRYAASQFPTTPPAGRFVSLLGDAELDEGAIWETVMIHRSPGWASCSGWSTSTGSPWTGWCPTSRSPSSRACSLPPVGRSSCSSGAG